MKYVWLPVVWIMAAMALRAESPVEGVWTGRFPDRSPAVTLRLTERDGALSGVVIFYLNKRGETVGADEQPLIHPKFLNQTLSFDVTRSSDGEVLRFQMKLRSANEGELSGENQIVVMKKVE